MASISLFTLAILAMVHFSHSTNFTMLVAHGVGNVVCQQMKEFVKSSNIPPPAKTKPSGTPCGWYVWNKCADQGNKICGSTNYKECKQDARVAHAKVASAEEEEAASPPATKPTSDAPPHKYPSVVMITNNGQQICSGAIIDPDWAITAAHCLTSDVAKNYRIVAGQYDQNNPDGDEQILAGYAIFKHEKYDENTLANDIALIKLSRTLDVNEKVKPVPLPDPGSSPQGTCEVAGWGQFSVSESSNKTVLQEVPVPIMDPSGCKAKTDRKISEHEMCVGAEADKNHTCIGDSGGPLYNQNGGKAVVIGIASSGVGCNNGGKPAVYMKLSAYTDWIKSTMGSNAGPAPKKRGERIVGGNEAVPHKYPAIAMMKLQGSHACGGTIINENWVLTAGHCLQHSQNINDYAWVAAEHNKNQNEGPEQEVKVVSMHTHKNYDAESFENDIALVKISPPFKMNAKVRAAVLPPDNYKPTGKLWVAGWGAVKENGPTSGILKEVSLPVLTAKKCKALVDDPNMYTKKVICTGYAEGGQDACQGDSGGPLFHVNGGQQILVGVVSWGEGCARKNSPGIFTKVAFYLDWMKSTMQAGGRAIIGGTQSMLRGKPARYKYPSMAVLKRDGVYVCVATIIHKEWVITPASCITSKRAADYQITAGEYDLKKYEDSEQTVTAKTIIVHDGFKAETHENDLALINVAPPFKLEDRVLVAKLPNRVFKNRNLTLYLAGWGLRHLTSLSGPLLSYEVQVQSVDATECKKLRDDPEKIRFNTFCTIPDDIPDCYADLGSPVYRHDHIFGRLFVGIRTSHSCTKADPVEVYAPMSHYLEWIRKYTTPEFAGRGTSRITLTGTPSSLTAYPGAVSIYVRNKPTCSGVMIEPTWILTSAYCLRGNTAPTLKIVAGKDDLTVRQDPDEQIAEVVEIYEHPEYNSQTGDNDIGLVYVDPPFPVDEKIKPSSFGPFATGNLDSIYSVGWGADSLTPSTFKEVHLKLSSECKNIRKGTACTSEAAKNQGPCRGDPGSPVFDRSARGEAIVVGVQGGEKTCGPKGNPGIVTKIEHYVSWISKTMRYGLNLKDTRILPVPPKVGGRSG